MENKKSKVFVIMPFKDVFFEVYEMISSEFSEMFEFSHAADEGNQQNILADIIQPIYEADVIIADLTGLNPNVLYELGVAHTFNKKTIVITQDDLNTLPFDLKQYRAKDYSTHFKKFAELMEHLKTCLNGAISGDVVFSNPVKDFVDKHKIDIQNNYSNDKIQLNLDDGEKGFIDFFNHNSPTLSKYFHLASGAFVRQNDRFLLPFPSHARLPVHNNCNLAPHPRTIR